MADGSIDDWYESAAARDLAAGLAVARLEQADRAVAGEVVGGEGEQDRTDAAT